MSYGEAWEQLHAAVLGIATSRAAPQRRLMDAVIHHLDCIDPDTDLHCAETRAWFVRLMNRLTAVEIEPGRRSLSATVIAMTDEEVEETLIDIVSLYDEVTRQEAAADLIPHSRPAEAA